MRKIKLATVLLASVLGLASCDVDLGFIQFSTDPTNDNGGQGGQVVNAVNSVTITGAKGELAVGATLQLSATVDVTGVVAKGVTWSTSDAAVATVEKGKVTAIAEGTVTITAVSNADNTKFDAVEIKVVNQGFDPTFISDGYTYSETFPVDLVMAFLGDGNYEVKAPENYSGNGYYYISYEETETSAACFEIIADGALSDAYATDRVEDGWDKVYAGAELGMEMVDPTLLYTLAVYEPKDEDYEALGFTVFDYYKSADVWADGTRTTDTAWNPEAFEDEYDEFIAADIALVPFMQIGQYYMVEYADYAYLKLLYEYFLGRTFNVPDTVIAIGDYTIDPAIFEGYPALLLDEGFKATTMNYSDLYVGPAYEKEFDYKTLSVATTFTSAGNTILAVPELKELDAYPTAGVAAFANEYIQSIKSLPLAYDKTADAKFTFNQYYTTDDNDNSYPVAEVTIDHALKTEMEAYVSDMENAGYEVEYTAGDDEYYPSWSLQLGKICVSIVFVQDYDDETEAYSDTEGSFTINIFADETAHEVPGLYTDKADVTVKEESTVTLSLEVVDLGDSPVITYESADPTIATVDENGVVTGVAAGTTTVTASTTYSDTPYSVTFNVTVKAVANGATFDFSKMSKTSGSANGFAFTTAQAGNTSSGPAYNDSKQELRLYIDNTITFTSSKPMTSIFFDANTCGESKATGTLSCDVGTVTQDDDGFHWTGNATSVTFTVNSGKQVHINKIVINGGGDADGDDEGLATCASVCEELSSEIFDQDEDIFYEEDGVYYAWAEFDEGSDLLECVELVAAYIPESYLEVNAPYEDKWDDESDGAFAVYCVDNIVIEIGAYDDSEYECVTVQIAVYEADAE